MINTIVDDLKNNIINFIDKNGNIKATFDFFEKKPYFYGEITNDKEIKIVKKSKKSKYNDMIDYVFSDDEYVLYKITFRSSYLKNKYNYILVIYKNHSEDSAYTLIIYNIYHRGVYIKYLIEHSVYTSSI